MTADERERYESEVDTELGKVWHAIDREQDREALLELLHAVGAYGTKQIGSGGAFRRGDIGGHTQCGRWWTTARP